MLAVLPERSDEASLRQILVGPFWRVTFVRDMERAESVLARTAVGVVICDSAVDAGAGWKAALRLVSGMRRPPLLIVTGPPSDSDLWSEVISLGGYDMLLKPFCADEVSRVLGVAVELWSDPPQGPPPRPVSGAGADPQAGALTAALPDLAHAGRTEQLWRNL